MSNGIPAVGMGVTEIMHSDRHAWTIIEIISPRKIIIQRDNVKRTDKNGMSEQQTWNMQPDPNGATRTVTLRKNGRWITEGDSSNGTFYAIGVKNEYYDFSF